eukprot:TRINITY_DN3549_c0_g1_i7.p1 TRINITY_DN3549_c0_g1~~TRINITY_DN3549_c0_g1_i7.p1  ORF type:complete len:203 (-),score=62.46 TRINITY_DN3549_c0_g1_i7:37-645(-)
MKIQATLSILTLSISLAVGAPQGLLNGLSNLLTGWVGGDDNAGEVDSYQNAPYSVVQKFDGYEERYYPSVKWVCTRTGGFNSLFGYISGTNSRNQKIDMTVPVMMTQSEKGSEMCFYITEEFQSNPPQPTGDGVYISNKKSMSVFAMTMGGYPNMEVEARKLREKLEKGRASQVDFSSYMSMSYDSPWKVVNRRDDVMYRKL